MFSGTTTSPAESTRSWTPAIIGRAITGAGLRSLATWVISSSVRPATFWKADPDLSHYDLIVPCGLADRKVTSLHKELGDDTPSLEEAKAAMTRAFRTKLNS